MLYGTGQISILVTPNDTGLFPEFLSPPCPATFSFQAQTQTVDLPYLTSSGVVGIYESGLFSETYILTLEIQDSDFNALQLALGELSLFTTALDSLDQELVTYCPLTSTTIVDGRINTTTATKTFAYNRTENAIMEKIGVVPSSSNTFQVDADNNEIIFAPSQVGQTIDVLFTESSVPQGCIGGVADDGEFFQYSFTGLFFGTSEDPLRLEIPQMRRFGAPTLTFNGDAVSVTLRFIAVCGDQGEQGRRKPFKLYGFSNVSIEECCIALEDGFDILLEDESGCIELEACPLPVADNCYAIEDSSGVILLEDNSGCVLLQA